jgi:hypothetical protein
MTAEPDRQAELRELLEALCEERITAAQAARLEALVLADPQAEALYITYLTMQADLAREFGGHPAARGVPSGARAGDGGGDARPSVPLIVRPAGPPARRWSWSWVPWALAAAACALAAVTTSLSPWARPGGGPPGAVGAVPGSPSTGGGRLLVNDRDAVAVVTKLVDARWELPDGAAPAEGLALPAGRLQLRSGLATLTFVNGVTLTLEGPADVDLITTDRVFCRRGKLRTRVPKGADGFVVASPSYAVVDLGTEFALNVGDDGQAHVMVFEGAAEAALLSDAGVPRRSQLVERGKAFQIDPRAGRIREAVSRPEAFVSAPTLVDRELNLAPSYVEEVLRARPRGYWRFESLTDGAVPNEVAGGPPLRAHGAVYVARGAGGNGCSVFPPDNPGQCLDLEGLWELPSQPGHAVEFWFLSEGISYMSLVGLYPPRHLNTPDMGDRFVHTFLVEATAYQHNSLQKPASVRFLHRWPLDIKVKDSLFSEGYYAPRRWHHVVAQKNDGRLELFFDGQMERSMPLEVDHPTLSCHMIVGRRTPESENPKDSRSFVGRLDELAIYYHPLSADEVRAHYRLGSESVSAN